MGCVLLTLHIHILTHCFKTVSYLTNYIKIPSLKLELIFYYPYSMGTVLPRSVEVIIENVLSGCAISAKLGTHMTIRLG
jgi:hypothetical protein